MIQDPNPHPSDGSAMPPVDQVIHEIRESEGHLRSAETAGMTEPPAHEVAHAAPVVTQASGRLTGHTALPPVGVAAAAVAGGHDGASAHGDAGHDGHGHASAERLGPLDTANWGAGILGVLVGLVIVVCFAIATQGLGAY